MLANLKQFVPASLWQSGCWDENAGTGKDRVSAQTGWIPLKVNRPEEGAGRRACVRVESRIGGSAVTTIRVTCAHQNCTKIIWAGGRNNNKTI